MKFSTLSMNRLLIIAIAIPIVGLALVVFIFLDLQHRDQKISQESNVLVVKGMPLGARPLHHELTDTKIKDSEQKAILDEIEALMRKIAQDPRDWKSYLKRSLCRERLQDYRGQIDDCTKAIKLNPTCAEAYEVRGSAWYRLNELQKAAEDWKQAINLNPEYRRKLEPLIKEIDKN